MRSCFRESNRSNVISCEYLRDCRTTRLNLRVFSHPDLVRF